MTKKTDKPPRGKRDDRTAPDPGAKAATEPRLRHYTLGTTANHHVWRDLPDRPPVIRPLPGGAGATVSFIAAGRPFRAVLPDVSMREARVRAGRAQRLVRAARDRELQAEAILRGDPTPAAGT